MTLRGFKSFADRTRLDLESGLVGIVGPNGSGKSNLIDALVWALGTLSARSLRAEKMEDVIFVGTPTRPALGMASVTLAFDNSSGAFPVDVAEVSVGRTLYRDGASEYTVNGTPCRLLDLQELMAEAGLGRELHAVVAQGQVDEIVNASPALLRSHVEEAAGIAKHRRRSDKAMRKIARVDEDLARVSDLLGEVRRQIRPLQAQADAAGRHSEMTSRLTELQLQIAVGELTSIETERAGVVESRRIAAEALAVAQADLEQLKKVREAADAKLEASRRSSGTLRRGLDHLRAAQASAMKGVLQLRESITASADSKRAVDAAERLAEAEREADVLNAELKGVTEGLTAGAEARRAAAAERDEASAQVTAARQRVRIATDNLAEAETKVRAAERESVAAKAAAEASSERIRRAAERLSRAEEQSTETSALIEKLQSQLGSATAGMEQRRSARDRLVEQRDAVTSRHRAAEAEAARLNGRLESLRVARDLTISRRRAAEDFASSSSETLGLKGVLGDALKVAPGLEAAVEAVLGNAVDALIVNSAQLPEAVAAAEEARVEVSLVGTLSAGQQNFSPPGARPLAAVVDAPGWLKGTVESLLSNSWLVDEWSTAVELAREHSHATFVTTSGRVLRPTGVSRPARTTGASSLGLAEAIERTESSLEANTSEMVKINSEVAEVASALKDAESELAAVVREHTQVEARLNSATDRLAELDAAVEASRSEMQLGDEDRVERLARQTDADRTIEEMSTTVAELRAVLDKENTDLETASQRLAAAEEALRDATASAGEHARHEATLSERLRGLEARQTELRAELAAHSDAPVVDPAILVEIESFSRDCDAEAERIQLSVRELLTAEESLESEFRRASADVTRAEVEVTNAEPRVAAHAEQLTRCDVLIEQIGTRLATELGVAPSKAKAEHQPSALMDEMRSEAKKLDAELRRIGPVNPLAAEELIQLTERQEFVEGQVEDLRSSRRDLVRLVRATENRMREMLTAAVTDADARFSDVIAILFPEGDGKLRLINGPEDDPLTGGVEIEVRLGRKGPRRLAFLSGGERALAGLGFLFALHLARPTPFLVLDEVDAPLDDANLSRFVRLLDALRANTQVLVITHQKRTMEHADSLVGVTLNQDGTSALVTQRLRAKSDAVPAEPVAAGSIT